MFQAPIDIRRTLEHIQNRTYVLPAIQREFVWSRKQICDLFDSLMREYPIGSFLFWTVAPATSQQFRFYEVMTRYHERDFRHNDLLQVAGPTQLTAILDGQQRLSSLAIGLLGTHTEKLPRKRWNNPDAFPETALYLELLHKAPEEEDFEYRFEFDRPQHMADENQDESIDRHWYRVSEILQTENGPPLLEYLTEKGLDGDGLTRAYKVLDRLWNAVNTDKVIAFHEEEDQKIDRVLEIFIRVNSGGTKLSYSDLLLSIASAQWQERDAREEIHGLVDDMNMSGQGFGFSKDLVLKSALVLTDIPSIRFQVANFNAANMALIEQKWDRIAAALRIGSRLLAKFGFSDRTLVADSVLIPIADYIYQRSLNDAFLTNQAFNDDRAAIRSWVIRSQLKRGAWGAGLDTLLT
ncbi:MAG: DUF262 domain-containing protein, partial [bacterium]